MTTALLSLLVAATPQLASPEWSAVNLKPELVELYAQQLADGIRVAGVRVITSQDIKTLLDRERQKQLTGCASDGSSCMAELAAALGCDGTITVNVARFEDGSFRGLAKVLSSKDGSVLASVKLDAKSDRGLSDAIEAAAPALAAPFVTTAPRAASARRLWWIPAAVGALSAAGSAFFFVDVGRRATQVSAASTYDEALVAASAGKGSQLFAWSLFAVTVAAAATTGALLVFGDGATTTVALTPTMNGLRLSGVFP